MKKKIRTILIILLFIIICYNIYKFLIIEHNFKYKVKDYSIDEHFYLDNGHYYDITITNKKENYSYTINEDLGKQKKIIGNIKTFKSNNLVCIVPIYKKNIDTNIYCDLDNKQVSIDYLLKSNNSDFKEIKKDIKKYNIKLPNSSDNKKEYKKLTIYNKNIIDDDIYYIWDYKGIYILDSEENNYQKILDYDLYDNIMSCIVGKYYVLFENNSASGIENIHYYNYKNGKTKVFKLKEKIAKDSYINGVVDNLIYVTDRKNKKEYTINVDKEKIEEIDDDQTEYIVYINGEKKTLSKSDFFATDQYFENAYIKDEKITNSEELIKSKNYYYFKEDNKIYKSLDTSKTSSILLLELNDIKEWQVVDNEIIILTEDTIYNYSDKYGLRKILENNEFKYNYKNIYKLGKK